MAYQSITHLQVINFFCHKNLFALLLVFGSSLSVYAQTGNSLNQNQKTAYTWDDIKCDDPASAGCYSQIYGKIVGVNTEALPVEKPDIAIGPVSSISLKGSYEGYTTYELYEQRTEYVTVTIHGLWGDAGQFTSTLNQMSGFFRSTEFNRINVTLPGHLRVLNRDTNYLESIRTNKPFASFSYWIETTKESLKIAKQLGRKTILIGQSTGGLLAVYAALYWPELVDQIVLIEPALRVNDLMNFGACLSRNVPEGVVRFLGQIIGMNVPDGVSVRMGCEVQKLADTLFSRQVILTQTQMDGAMTQAEDFSVYSTRAQKIKVPVLMINNENDKIVSSLANHSFFEGVTTAKNYIPINHTEFSSPHGLVTSSDPILIADAIVRFNFKLNAQSTMAKIFFYRQFQQIEFLATDACRTFKDIVVCKALSRIRAETLHERISEICEALPFDCVEISKNINIVTSFWSSHLQNRLRYGNQSAENYLNEMRNSNTSDWQALRQAEVYLKFARGRILGLTL